MAHAIARHLLVRQDSSTPPASVGSFRGAITVNTDAATAITNFAFDSTVVPVSVTAPPLTPQSTGTTTSAASTSSTTSQPTASSSAVSASGSQPLAMSTVVGACVGALIGTVALVLLGLWFYRRYLQNLKLSAKSRAPLSPGSGSRNKGGDEQRRRSRLEPWNKLQDEEDKWEDSYQTKEVDSSALAPMEKLTMFKKTPSVRTAYTHKTETEETPAFDLLPHPFANVNAAVPRTFMGRANAPQEVSWDGETVVGQNSYLSLNTKEVSGAMSPSLNMAIPTPPAQTADMPHRWESAEVVHFDDAQSTEVLNTTITTPLNSNNPFASPEREPSRKSTNNPFFNAQSTSRSRSNSVSKSPTSKGKERAISINPFDDDNEPLPKPPFIPQHAATSSASSVSSNDRAIQSLIAALDVSEEEIQSRLRVASMQPSVYSGISMYTSAGEDEDVTREFPLPPAAGANASTHTLKREGSNHTLNQ